MYVRCLNQFLIDQVYISIDELDHRACMLIYQRDQSKQNLDASRQSNELHKQINN